MKRLGLFVIIGIVSIILLSLNTEPVFSTHFADNVFYKKWQNALEEITK